ncbi:Piso0_001282 [Millerozyma farinosa CBS 7064]|uniref:Piso0_001282 protein n=1 Tax=Pichia sorbitophila (strain ATCC MYA-4447 / BCRC 22081 / CBS 7064 / NBRC 10061 / NRRL Y-12695) TaxID=559304 RepID=G8YMR3_PICSO|nr:Piso0_001282 [Millerozyma farinosa CBS 7064]
MSVTRRDTCESGNDFDNANMGARISAVFVIFVLSAFGSFMPIVAKKAPRLRVPDWFFFIVRYFGTGVIVATGFIHLLAEAEEELGDDCLGGIFDVYPWPAGIALMGVIVMFFLDVYAHNRFDAIMRKRTNPEACSDGCNEGCNEQQEDTEEADRQNKLYYNESTHDLESDAASKDSSPNMNLEMINSFVLEFGIVFHSVFVGLSLAIAGDEFKTLYAAISFHQMFEGLGLGSRFAMTQWPRKKWYIPWVLALAYSLVTPLGIAVGLGVRKSYPPGSRTSLIVTGVFDSFCGGILIYNSLVELMANDFLYSSNFKNDHNHRKILSALFCLSLGAFAMALIGRWA